MRSVLAIVESLWTAAVDILGAVGLVDAVPPIHEHMSTPTATSPGAGGGAISKPVVFPTSALEASLSQIALHGSIRPIVALRDRRWRSHTLRLSQYVQRGLSDWAKSLHAAKLQRDANIYDN